MTIDSSSLFNDPPITATRVYAGEVRVTDDLIFWNKITGVIKAKIHADDGNLHFEVNEVDRMIIKSDGELEIDGYIKSTNPSFSIASDQLVFRDSALNQLGYIDDQGVIHGLTLNLSSQLPVIDINSGTTGTLNNSRLGSTLEADIIIPKTGTKIQLGSSTLYSPYINDTNYELHCGVVKARTTNLNFYADNYNVYPLAGGASKFSVNSLGVVNAPNGSGIQNLNAGFISSGTINNARLPTTPTFNGINFNTLGSTDWAKFYTEGTADDENYEFNGHRLVLELGDDEEDPAEFIIRRLYGNEVLFAVEGDGRVSAKASFNAPIIEGTTGTFFTLSASTKVRTNLIEPYSGTTLAIPSSSNFKTNEIRSHDTNIYYKTDTHTFANTDGTSTYGTLNNTGLVVGEVANQFGHKLNVVGSSYFNGVVNIQKYLRSNGVEFELSANGNGANPFKIATDGTCFLTGTEAIKGFNPILISATNNNYFRALSDGDNYSDSNNLYIRDLDGSITATFDNDNHRMSIGNIVPSPYKLRVDGNASFNDRIRISNGDDPMIEFCRGGTNLTHAWGSTAYTDHRIVNDLGVLNFQSRISNGDTLDHLKLKRISNLGMVEIINNLGVGVAPNTGYRIDLGTNGGNMRGTTFHAVSASHETYYVSYGMDHFYTDFSITSATSGKNINLNTFNGQIRPNSPVVLSDATANDLTGAPARPNQRFSLWTDELFGMELQKRNGTWNTSFVTRNADGGFRFATDEGNEVFYIDSRAGGNSRIAYGTSGEYINLKQIGLEPSILPSTDNFGYCGIQAQAWYFVWTNFLRVKDDLYGGFDNGVGNFHIDSVEGSGAIYLNWYGGTGGIRCGNGSAGYGPVYASSYPGTSDDRLKHNEEDIVDALGTINKLKLQKYDKTSVMLDANFNGDLGDIPHEKEIGFIAQDIQQIPELAFLVKEHDTIPIKAEGPVLEGEKPPTIQQEQPLTLNYQGITNVAIQAIQELDAKCKAQQDQINNLIQIVNELRQNNTSTST